MSPLPGNGMLHLSSPFSGAETVSRLEDALRAKGLTIFAQIDHSGEAKKAGFEMLFAQVLIFGSPKAGTPLMIAAPTLAIDLPLKALVWEDAERKVWVTYNAPDYLEKRHGVPHELMANIAGAGKLLESALA